MTLTTKNQAARTLRAPGAWILAFTLLLVFPSLDLLVHYLTWLGTAVFTFLIMICLLLILRLPWPQLAQKLAERQVTWLMVATVLGLLIIFMIVYPLANSSVPGKGSDRDEALNTATTELLHGRYPYRPVIYSGNPITPMPGALILAAPFVLLGNSAFQNFFWLLAFLFTMRSYFRYGLQALVLLWLLLLLSPVVIHEIVTGGDLLANSIYVLLFSYWLVALAPRASVSSASKLLLAALFGIGLASRATFLVLIPLIFVSLAKSTSWRTALLYCTTALLTFALLTVPFYLYDPAGFSPLHTVTKLEQFRQTLPFAGAIIPGIALLLAVALSIFRSDDSLQRLMENGTVVLALPVLGAAFLQALNGERPWYTWAGLGISYLFFGAVALWPPPDPIPERAESRALGTTGNRDLG